MIVLDASALVAAVRNEEGGQRVRTILGGDGVMMNTANYAEVLQKLVFLGVDPQLAEDCIDACGIAMVDLNQTVARLVAHFHRRASALSLADRACLATARVFASVALTADQAWIRYAPALGVEVELIRAA